jgi:hypothetical protein
MRKQTSLIFQVILGLIIGGAVCTLLVSLAERRDRRWKECEDRGGVFIVDREVCVDAKRIPLTN